jgi:tRNA threonylcarbamoyl adenosine modification protein (Sua5/YciO/YrdC/YwlC family)
MKVVPLPEILESRRRIREIVAAIIEGRVFLYPTDTIYGLGCDASNPRAVRRIRKIKFSRLPFSVIAPSREWIEDNLIVTRPGYLDRLPGHYTLIFRMKGAAVCGEAARGTLGVRIPDHPFTGVVQGAGVPFVTTSANMSGEAPVWSTYGVPAGIERSVDIAVHGGILNNPPSRVIDLTGRKPRILR